MTRADFPEAAHARHSSARKGEATAEETFQPNKVRRLSEIGLLLLHLPTPPPPLQESSERPPSPALRRVRPSSALRRGQFCPAFSSGRRHLEEFLRGKPPGSCGPPALAFVCQGSRGSGAGELCPSGLLDLAAQGGRRTLLAKGPDLMGRHACENVKIQIKQLGMQ